MIFDCFSERTDWSTNLLFLSDGGKSIQRRLLTISIISYAKINHCTTSLITEDRLRL